MLNNWLSKIPSAKAMRRIDWYIRGFLGFSIALNCYTLWKTKHLATPTWAVLGFNIAAFIYGDLLRRSYKRNDNLWSIILDQQNTIGHLYKLLDGNKQLAGMPRSPINPDRN